MATFDDVVRMLRGSDRPLVREDLWFDSMPASVLMLDGWTPLAQEGPAPLVEDIVSDSTRAFVLLCR